MKKINVYFKHYLLGYLHQIDGKIAYTSNIEGEKQFADNAFSSAFYTLFNRNQAILSSLPSFLQDYALLTNNAFYISQANITNQDNEFEKLYKLSFLPFDDIGFYISQK